MLQTDLHNPSITKKMTPDDFVNNNRGINNGQNLSKEYLEKLYHNIKAEPITLKEDDDARARLEAQSAQTPDAKARFFQKEAEVLLARVLKGVERMKTKLTGTTGISSLLPTGNNDDNPVVRDPVVMIMQSHSLPPFFACSLCLHIHSWGSLLVLAGMCSSFTPVYTCSRTSPNSRYRFSGPRALV